MSFWTEKNLKIRDAIESSVVNLIRNEKQKKKKKDLSLDIMIAHKNKTKQVDTAWREFKMIDTDVLPYISHHLLTEWDFFLIDKVCAIRTSSTFWNLCEPRNIFWILAEASDSLLNLKQLV